MQCSTNTFYSKDNMMIPLTQFKSKKISVTEYPLKGTNQVDSLYVYAVYSLKEHKQEDKMQCSTE